MRRLRIPLLDGMSRDRKRSKQGVELVLLEDLGKPTRIMVSLDNQFELFLQRCQNYRQPTGCQCPSSRVRSRVPVDRYDRSFVHYDRAKRSLARGVSSAMKATQLPVPIFVDRGMGSRLWDVDGNEYIDFALSFGPMLLGQSPDVVLEAVRSQLDAGIGFGAGNRHEAPLAELICDLVPSAELVIFSNTGTEAVQAALRVARAATGRSQVIKFRGHYHGWLDSVHIAIPGFAGDGAGTGGQDAFATHNTRVCEWNNIESLGTALSSDVAAVIMEPINVNGGCFLPHPGYLKAVQRLTRDAGALLIFDEVITGFRVALGGAQQLLGVVPDLTVLGKALGSGFPISAVCGSREVLSVVASGAVSHMGNFNGSPIAAAAGHATLKYLKDHSEQVYPKLGASTEAVAHAFDRAQVEYSLPIQFNRTVGAGFGFVAERPVVTHDDRLHSNPDAYGRFAARMLDKGVYIPTRGLWYVSTEHSNDDLAQAADAILMVAKDWAEEQSEVAL
jgi:glutamate-1-semialdehyde 2,1-aminomutase